MKKVTVSKLHTYTGHRDAVYTIQQPLLNNLFFSASGDGMVVQWDLTHPDEGALIARLPNSIYALHHHAATEHLIVGQNFAGIHVLDWKNKKEISSLQLTTAAIFDVQSAGDYFFVGSGDGHLFKIQSNSLTIVNKNQLSDKSARTIAVHEQRGEVAVGYSDNHVRVFDMETLKLKHEWQAHTSSVFTVRYTPDGLYLMSGSRDARLKVWDVSAQYKQAAEVVAHMYAINHLDFSPDGKHFVTCSMDKSIKVWDAEELKLLKVIDKARHAGHGTSVNKLFWTSYHGQLVSASDDRTLSAWSINIETP